MTQQHSAAPAHYALCDQCRGRVVADDAQWRCLACGCVWDIEGRIVGRGDGCTEHVGAVVERLMRKWAGNDGRGDE